MPLGENWWWGGLTLSLGLFQIPVCHASLCTAFKSLPDFSLFPQSCSAYSSPASPLDSATPYRLKWSPVCAHLKKVFLPVCISVYLDLSFHLQTSKALKRSKIFVFLVYLGFCCYGETVFYEPQYPN